MSKGSSEAEAYLRSIGGGSCKAVANGENWGSLPRNYTENYGGDESYVEVAPSSTTQESIFFHKGRCDVKIQTGEKVSLDAILVKKEGGKSANIRISFRNQPLGVR